MEFTKNREKWNEENHLRLYEDFFQVFSLPGYHTLSYISDYLENLYEYNQYEIITLKFYLGEKE